MAMPDDNLPAEFQPRQLGVASPNIVVESDNPLFETKKLPRLAHQFIKFVLVGIPTTIVHYAVLITSVEVFGIHPVVATTAGFSVAAVLSFLLNRRFTFDAKPSFRRGLALYYAGVSLGLMLNALIVWVLMSLGMIYILAQVIATGLVMIWNFLAARFIVFAVRS